MPNKYNKDNVLEAISVFRDYSNMEKYATLMKISSSYYDIELNGIHIEDIAVFGNILKIILPNKRKMKLKITDDFELKIQKE